MEKEAASILSTLIDEHLRYEASKVCELLLPLLGQYSKEQLERELESLLTVEEL
jgi:hypothetical protein